MGLWWGSSVDNEAVKVRNSIQLPGTNLEGIRRDLSVWGTGLWYSSSRAWAETGSGRPRDTGKESKPGAFFLLRLGSNLGKFYVNSMEMFRVLFLAFHSKDVFPNVT